MNLDYLKTVADKLINIDSPSGYTFKATKYLEEETVKLGYKPYYTEKGNLIIEVEGEDNETIAIASHVDTLGLMVRSITSDGHLKITRIGGPSMPTLDGEYCRIYTRDNKVYTGTILSTSNSVHVYKDAGELARNEENMEVRLDEIVNSKDDVLKLGINNGDIIAIEPKFQITESGFVKSRFLDDKISASCLLYVLKYLKDENIRPKHKLCFMFTTYEEVGHGASYIPSDIKTFLAVDMGCIGQDLACKETDVSICAKDSSGPYDYNMVSQLSSLAKENNLDYVIDIYPYYGSDASCAISSGNNIKTALIGPGIGASHGMERTHLKALENTIKLIIAYINA